MKTYGIGSVVVVGLVSVLATAETAPAQTAAETVCRQTILKNVGKYVKTAGKAIVACHKKRNGDKLPSSTDCNDLSVADFKDKLTTVAAGFHAAMAAKCVSVPGVLARYPTCKSPAASAGTGGATVGIDDFDELADCEIALARELSQSTARQILGSPDVTALLSSPVAKTLAKCHSVIGRNYTKALDVYIKERGRCQTARDKNGMGLAYGCEGMDPSFKIAGAKTKLNDAIQATCGTLSLADVDIVDSCGDTSAQLQDCVTANIVSKIGSGLSSMAYGLSICPRGVDVLVRAGLGSSITDTDIDLGSSGFFHDQDVPDLSRIAVTLDCNPTCSSCAVALNPKVGTAEGNCRCRADATMTCSTINGNDGNCPSGGLCDCFFLPPHPVGGGGSSLCIVQRMNSDFSGVVDVGAGSSSTLVDLSAVVYLGISLQQPCPVCQGDIVVLDGIRNGTCLGGARNGAPCDATASSCTYGPVSYECPPALGANISGSGLQIDFNPLTDGSVSQATGPCGGATNACVNACVPVSAMERECDSNGPVDSYCDGAVTCAGEGYTVCSTTADCTPLSAGTCTPGQTRDCFVDPVTATGNAASGGGPFFGDQVSAFCVPPVIGSGINAAIGLPGPGRVRYDMIYDPKCGICQNSPTTQCFTNPGCGVNGPCIAEPSSWNPPTGSLCP